MSADREGGMGNASGRTGMENGNGDFPAARTDCSVSPSAGLGQSPSLDSMAERPPPSPRRSRSPFLIAPQLPLSAFQRIADGSQTHQLWANHSPNSSDFRAGKSIPTLISWYHGGNDVAVEGSWDNWSSRTALHRSGKDHCVLLVLSPGIYHYKFIVDGECRFIPDLPHMTDFTGHSANILQVTEYVPENLESISEFEAPPSPESSYQRMFLVDDDFAKEPPALPPHLPLAVPGSKNSDLDSSSFRKPNHVELNHLFIEKGWASQSMVALNITHRFQSKVFSHQRPPPQSSCCFLGIALSRSPPPVSRDISSSIQLRRSSIPSALSTVTTAYLITKALFGSFLPHFFIKSLRKCLVMNTRRLEGVMLLAVIMF